MKQLPIPLPNSLIKPFQFKDHTVRTAFKDFETWFCLLDVCKALGIQNHKEVKSRLNPHGVDTIYLIDAMGRKQKTFFINESNLYKLIFRSRRPEAIAFEDWVTGEVLPSIRKTGSYSHGQQPQLDAPSTVTDRKPITDLLNTWVKHAPIDYRSARIMLNAYLGVESADQITLAQIQPAKDWLQEQINLYTAKPVEQPKAHDIITEQALKGTKAFICRLSVEEPTGDQEISIVHRQFKATVYITEEPVPHIMSTQISTMLDMHHKK